MWHFSQRKRFRAYLLKVFHIQIFGDKVTILLLSVEIILSNILKLTQKHENNIKKSQIVLISCEKCVIIYTSIKLIYIEKSITFFKFGGRKNEKFIKRL